MTLVLERQLVPLLGESLLVVGIGEAGLDRAVPAAQVVDGVSL